MSVCICIFFSRTCITKPVYIILIIVLYHPHFILKQQKLPFLIWYFSKFFLSFLSFLSSSFYFIFHVALFATSFVFFHFCQKKKRKEKKNNFTQAHLDNSPSSALNVYIYVPEERILKKEGFYPSHYLHIAVKCKCKYK